MGSSCSLVLAAPGRLFVWGTEPKLSLPELATSNSLLHFFSPSRMKQNAWYIWLWVFFGGITTLESARNNSIGHLGALHLNTKGRLGGGFTSIFFFLPHSTECWQNSPVPRLYPLQREFKAGVPNPWDVDWYWSVACLRTRR